MKVALIISGYLRSFEINLDNIKKNIIDKFESTDVYIHITENEKNDDKYLNKNSNNLNDEIKNKLNPKCLIVEPNFLFSKNIKKNSLYNQWVKFYKLNEIKKINENYHGTYDLVIKLRPDLYFLSDIDFLNFDLEKSIYLPKDSKMDKKKLSNLSDGFLCDTFAFGNSKNMDLYFDFFKNLNYLVKKFGLISETLLYEYLKDKVKYTKFNLNYQIILSTCNIFAICGDSGSGKSTLSNVIKNFFSNSFTLECDRYHKWERGNLNWDKYTHLNPEANYITKMNEDVFNLKIGNSIYQVDYDHKTGKFTENQLVEASKNTIVCGLHSLYGNNNHLYNLKIFMDTDEKLKTEWKINRDTKERGHSLEHIKKQILERKNDYEKYIYPQKNKSDLVIRFFLSENNEVQLEIMINSKHNVTNILKTLSQNNLNYIIRDESNFIVIKFNEYKDVCLWDEPKPQYHNYYDYIIYFILNL